MTEPRVAAKPAPGLSLEQAHDARARAWAFVFECHAKKEAAGRLPSTDGRDGTKIKEISADGRIIRD